MGWLWACLGGGLNIQGSKRSKSLQRGKLSNQPHDLRLQPLPTQRPRNGYGVQEKSQLQKVHRASDSENTEALKIPTSSVNTCISINTLKKASERSLESSFRREFGLSMRSDVDELKEELAALKRRLANEEAEAQKLREEVSYLRSCGVLQRSEDSSDMRIYEGVPEVDDQAHVEQRQGNIAPVRQLRKCFSGPLMFASQSSPSKASKSSPSKVSKSSPSKVSKSSPSKVSKSSPSKVSKSSPSKLSKSSPSKVSTDSKDSPDSSGKASEITRTRISSHRAGLSPKGKSFVHSRSPSLDSYQPGEQDVDATADSNLRVSKVSLTSGLHQYPSTKVAAWTSQITEESQGMSRNQLVIMDSMDVHWIEVSNAPCASGFSTNVRRDEHHVQGDHAQSPRRPKLRAYLGGEDDKSGKSSQRLVGKRRQKRSMDFSEPIEKRSKEQESPPSQLPALTPEQIEEQLSQAVAAFKEQKRELELKHQSFCHGPTVTEPPPVVANNMVGFFRSSRRKAHAMRNHRGFPRSLSPVKEAASIEEVTWSRQSSASRLDPSAKPAESDSEGSKLTQGFKFAAKIVEDSSPVKMPPVEDYEEKPSAMENIAMIPIQCFSPSVSPKKRSSSSGGLDSLCALAMSSKTPAESRYQMEDSCEADWVHDWEDDVVEGTDIKPIECASPSFSDRRKQIPRAGSVRQSISFDATKESSPLIVSSAEFDDFLHGKSTPSPSGIMSVVRSPGGRSAVTPSPRKPWSPSPRKDLETPMMNERSWYCDAIEAIQSINDIRRSKEGLLHTESVSLGNSPAGKKAGGGPRPPHAFSAEKKMLRRAFSWYVSEHDERVRTCGLKGTKNGHSEQHDSKAGIIANTTSMVTSSRVQQPQLRLESRQSFSNTLRGAMVQHTRRFSDSDSGGSATFSIDFNRADSNSLNSSSQNGSSQNECDVRDSTGASFFRERGDCKENSSLIASRNSSLRTSDQSCDSGKHLRRSQESIPENRPVLGSMPFNNWDKNVRMSRDKNPSDLQYTEC